jgi:hypothetical protein
VFLYYYIHSKRRERMLKHLFSVQNSHTHTGGEMASTKPQKEKSDISIGDVINNGKSKNRSFRKMVNPQKYVVNEGEGRGKG